jgi:hypothetical protein
MRIIVKRKTDKANSPWQALPKIYQAQDSATVRQHIDELKSKHPKYEFRQAALSSIFSK